MLAQLSGVWPYNQPDILWLWNLTVTVGSEGEVGTCYSGANIFRIKGGPGVIIITVSNNYRAVQLNILLRLHLKLLFSDILIWVAPSTGHLEIIDITSYIVDIWRSK